MPLISSQRRIGLPGFRLTFPGQVHHLTTQPGTNNGTSLAFQGDLLAMGTPYWNASYSSQDHGAIYLADTANINSIPDLRVYHGGQLSMQGYSVAANSTRLIAGQPHVGIQSAHDNGGQAIIRSAITNTAADTIDGYISGHAANDIAGWSVTASDSFIASSVLSPVEGTGGRVDIVANDAGLTALDSITGGAYYFLNSVPPTKEQTVFPFGHATKAFGQSIVIGSAEEVVGGFIDAGQAFVYDINLTPATPHTLVHTLQSPAPITAGHFGFSVAMNADVIAVSDRTVTAGEVGRVHIFDRATGLLKFTINDPANAVDGWFGFSLALNSGYITIGAPHTKITPASSNGHGKTYVFSLVNGTLKQTITLSSAEDIFVANGGSFEYGYSVAMTDTRLAIGSPKFVPGGSGNTGVVDIMAIG